MWFRKASVMKLPLSWKDTIHFNLDSVSLILLGLHVLQELQLVLFNKTLFTIHINGIVGESSVNYGKKKILYFIELV